MGQYHIFNNSVTWNYTLNFTVQRKYSHRIENLNAKLIKLNYLGHETVIRLTLVILLSSDLDTILAQTEMKKTKLSSLDCLFCDN